LKIGFIGAGKVGFSLGKYFLSKGLKISGYYSLNKSSAEEAARFTLSKSFNLISEFVTESDFIFITTNDDQINNVCNQIKNFNIKNKLIAHCSGSLSSKYFQDILYDAQFYSIHPMYPFSDKYTSYKNLSEATFTIEGSSEAINQVKEIFSKLGNKILFISEQDKVKYHLANVYASNLYIALISTAVKHFNEIGISERDALNALLPLMEANINNMVTNGTINSLTGPIERGDSKTILKHLEESMHEDKEVYLGLSRILLNIAKEKNKERDYSAIRNILEGKL
jgi:Uncharacterized conserved protein